MLNSIQPASSEPLVTITATGIDAAVTFADPFAEPGAIAAGVLAASFAVLRPAEAAIIPISADTEIETNSSNPSDTYGTGNSGVEVDMYAGYAGFNAPFKILLV